MLVILAAIKAIVPPLTAVILPWLTMALLLSPANLKLPVLKSAVLIFKVLATRPPTLTCAVGLNNTPLGLIKNTWPLAVKLP